MLAFFSFSCFFPPCFCLFDLFLIFKFKFFFRGGYSWLSHMRQSMYPVCEDSRLGRESVYLLGRAGRKPNSFFLFAVGREIFSGSCTSLVRMAFYR